MTTIRGSGLSSLGTESRACSDLETSWTHLREAVPDVQASITCSWAEVHGQDPRRSFLPQHTASSCSCLGFSSERRSLKAKLSAQHVLRAFFTATIDEDFQGAPMLDAALSNEDAYASKKVTSVLATVHRNFSGAFSLSSAVQLVAQMLASS